VVISDIEVLRGSVSMNTSSNNDKLLRRSSKKPFQIIPLRMKDRYRSIVEISQNGIMGAREVTWTDTDVYKARQNRIKTVPYLERRLSLGRGDG
jgi:hypothetical protein